MWYRLKVKPSSGIFKEGQRATTRFALSVFGALVFAVCGVARPPAGTSGYFALSPAARQVYEQTLKLRWTDAQHHLQALRTQEPDNLIAPLLENYLDFLSILANDDRKAYERLAPNMNKRLSRIARGDPKSPYFLYTQAEIRFQWAVLRLRFGDHLSGLNTTRQAYKLLEENRRRHPEFIPNLKSLGILHALVGNIPPEYKWVLRLLSGMDGTVDQGLAELKRVLDDSGPEASMFEPEARAAYAYLLLHLANDKTAARQTLLDGRSDPRNNPLAAFISAHLAMRSGRNDEAIRLLEQAPRPGRDGYANFPYRDYLLGLAKLNRLDPDARPVLENFIRTFSGENGVKEALQKLAWSNLIAGDRAGYARLMQRIRVEGSDRSEPDKAALLEAEKGPVPDPLLTRARLLFDGGYYRRAYELLKPAAAAYDGRTRFGVEYAYRMGRICHELGLRTDAVQFYTRTLDAGAARPWYFACNAALQLGLLYEQLKDTKAARAAFSRCLDLKPEEYAASLHAKAKAGLNRVK